LSTFFVEGVLLWYLEVIALKGMTKEIREEVLAEASKKGLSQSDLADVADVTPTQMSRMLTGKSNGLPKAWEAVLKAVGLRLVVVPVDADLIVQRRM
jgi:transcriptional regulator with XRE-family HTH domain